MNVVFLDLVARLSHSGGDFATLCGALSARNVVKRVKAVRALEAFGDRACPVLLDCILSDDALLKQAAGMSLVRMGADAWRLLFRADDDEWQRLVADEHPAVMAAVESVYVQRRILQGVSAHGPVPERLLLAFLKATNRDEHVLLQVLMSLRKTAVSENLAAAVERECVQSVRALAGGLHSGTPERRIQCAVLLGRLGGAEAEAALTDIGVTDAYDIVRIASAQALAACARASLSVALVPMLGDSSLSVRIAVADVLGTLGEKSAVPALVAALRDPEIAFFKAAVEALVSIGNDKAIPVLAEVMHTHAGPEFRRVVIEALSRLGGQPVFDALKLSGAEDPCEENRTLARKATSWASAPG